MGRCEDLHPDTRCSPRRREEGAYAMTKAETYFNRSRIYAAAAEVATDADQRLALLEMAQRWARMGEIAERYWVLPDSHDSTDPDAGDGTMRNGTG